MSTTLDKIPADLRWFAENAESLDISNQHASEVVTQLAAQGFLKIGVAESLGWSGGPLSAAVEAIERVATQSVTAAFAFWGHRSFIEYVILSPNEVLRSRLLPQLLNGELAGASGLSNAIKFLSGIEQLQIQAEKKSGDSWRVDGILPWVTNLRTEGFAVAAVVARTSGEPPLVVALRSDQIGVERTDDLELLGLRGSNTAAVHLRDVDVQRDDLLHDNAQLYIPRIRPSFLAFQCGLSLGLASASLQAAEQNSQRVSVNVLRGRIDAAAEALQVQRSELLEGLDSGRFLHEPHAIFEVRIALADTVRRALELELESSGGRAYLSQYNRDFSRRWRESAFIPLVTPSLVQLQGELLKRKQQGL